MVTNQTLDDLREEYSKFSFQWIKGENMSQVNHYFNITEDNDKRYLIFTDGSRIDISLIDEYMILVEKGFEEKIEIRQTTPQLEMFIENQGAVRARESSKQVEQKPIFSLLAKQKENWVDVDLKLSINLPPRSLWDVLMSSFDSADDDILEFVTKDLDIEVVRDSLRQSIREIYNIQKNVLPAKNVRSQDNIPE